MGVSISFTSARVYVFSWCTACAFDSFIRVAHELTHDQLIETAEAATSWLCLVTMLEQQLLADAGIVLPSTLVPRVGQQVSSKLALFRSK